MNTSQWALDYIIALNEVTQTDWTRKSIIISRLYFFIAIFI